MRVACPVEQIGRLYIGAPKWNLYALPSQLASLLLKKSSPSVFMPRPFRFSWHGHFRSTTILAVSSIGIAALRRSKVIGPTFSQLLCLQAFTILDTCPVLPSSAESCQVLPNHGESCTENKGLQERRRSICHKGTKSTENTNSDSPVRMISYPWIDSIV
jgi:hypothetical protein